MVDGRPQTQAVKTGDRAVTFVVPLKAGRIKLHGQFLDADGKALCGAMFAYVTRQ